MSPDSEIDRDLNCVHCGYNLRGLPVKHRCPECGVPSVVSVARSQRTIPAGDQLYVPVAGDVGGTVDGVLFVQDCMRFALARAATRAGRPVRVDAREVCDAVRDYARAYFNDDAKALGLLDEWGVRCSEDVGRIIYAFIRRGLLRRTPQDSPDQYNGRFTLETLFAPGDGVG